MGESVYSATKKFLEQEAKPSAGLPEAWGVVYAEPNPDESRKSCSNCMMWSRDNKCSIHAADVEVKSSMVCGYHVFGKSMDERMDHEGMMPVTPELSGLDEVGEGTSCDICTYYSGGLCYAVDTPEGKPQPVEPLGCCARWETK